MLFDIAKGTVALSILSLTTALALPPATSHPTPAVENTFGLEDVSSSELLRPHCVKGFHWCYKGLGPRPGRRGYCQRDGLACGRSEHLDASLAVHTDITTTPPAIETRSSSEELSFWPASERCSDGEHWCQIGEMLTQGFCQKNGLVCPHPWKILDQPPVAPTSPKEATSIGTPFGSEGFSAPDFFVTCSKGEHWCPSTTRWSTLQGFCQEDGNECPKETHLVDEAGLSKDKAAPADAYDTAFNWEGLSSSKHIPVQHCPLGQYWCPGPIPHGTCVPNGFGGMCPLMSEESDLIEPKEQPAAIISAKLMEPSKRQLLPPNVTSSLFGPEITDNPVTTEFTLPIASAAVTRVSTAYLPINTALTIPIPIPTSTPYLWGTSTSFNATGISATATGIHTGTSYPQTTTLTTTLHMTATYVTEYTTFMPEAITLTQPIDLLFATPYPNHPEFSEYTTVVDVPITWYPYGTLTTNAPIPTTSTLTTTAATKTTLSNGDLVSLTYPPGGPTPIHPIPRQSHVLAHLIATPTPSPTQEPIDIFSIFSHISKHPHPHPHPRPTPVMPPAPIL